MSDSVSFKAYLKRDGQQVEVRRFGIDTGAHTSYLYLRSKIQAMFPSIQNEQFNIFWQDSENDYITVSSDEELIVAVTSVVTQPIKLYIHVRSDQTQGSNGQETQHPGVICDSCEGAVVGFRYKCVTCPDFDLCAGCEASGNHAEHFMIRVPTPLTSSCPPKFFRKMFTRPHKFKRHGYDFGHVRSGKHCPFSQQENAAGVPEMFDFSALTEFFSNLIINNTAGSGMASASAQATSSQTQATSSQAQATSSQTQATSSQAQATSSQTQATSSQTQATNSQTTSSQATSTKQPQKNPSQRQAVDNKQLTTIGQTIAAFLDPFGINVTFDVQPKASETPKTPAQSSASTPPTQQEPAASPPTSSPNSAVPQPTAAPVSSPAQSNTSRDTTPEKPIRERQNSDDWTLLSRESPVRSEVAMEVDESRGARPKTVYPELPKETPSAPPRSEESEHENVQDAIERIRSMGFNVDPSLLRDLVLRKNCDISSILEAILSNAVNK